MSLVVNNNMMAANVARNLNSHYSRLATSTQRLSSGLRVNSAADDAAGLAIRELQRADIAALHQGARNANDAISMIQVADGALGIIDEKLIRLKELAEQASTGTYDSTQRMMIESEYQAMVAEITRIAKATDFNGQKLLDGTLDGDHDGSGIDAKGKMKIHFGTSNDSAEDYYYVSAKECTSQALGLGNESTWQDVVERAAKSYGEELRRIYKEKDPQKLATIQDDIDAFKKSLEDNSTPTDDTTYAELYERWKALPEADRYNYWPSNQEFPADYAAYDKLTPNQKQKVQYAFGRQALTNFGTKDAPGFGMGVALDTDPILSTSKEYKIGENVTYFKDLANYDAAYDIAKAAADAAGTTAPKYGDPVVADLGAGDGEKTYTAKIDPDFKILWEIKNAPKKFDTDGPDPVALKAGGDITDLTIALADADEVAKQTLMSGDDITKQAAQYAYNENKDRDFAGFTVETQEDAQHALNAINSAIVYKDKIRANLGALQNRLENTVSNLNVQAENLQAAESRISDVDVGIEMTNFVKNQILTQSAVAMMAQANSLPQMAMQLIGG